MSIYRGISGVNRLIFRQFRGINGVNREIIEQWRSIEGVNRRVFTSGPIFKWVQRNLGSGGYANLINGGTGVSLYTGSTSASDSNTNSIEYIMPAPMSGTLVVNIGRPMTGYFAIGGYNSSGGLVSGSGGGYYSANTQHSFTVGTDCVRIRIATDQIGKYLTINSATLAGKPVIFSVL